MLFSEFLSFPLVILHIPVLDRDSRELDIRWSSKLKGKPDLSAFIAFLTFSVIRISPPFATSSPSLNAMLTASPNALQRQDQGFSEPYVPARILLTAAVTSLNAACMQSRGESNSAMI